MNSEIIWKIQRKIAKRCEKYGRKVGWNVKWYGQYGRKVGWIVKWYGKYGRNEGKDIKNPEENSEKIWKLWKKSK